MQMASPSGYSQLMADKLQPRQVDWHAYLRRYMCLPFTARPATHVFMLMRSCFGEKLVRMKPRLPLPLFCSPVLAEQMSWADLQKEVALLSRFLTQVPGLAPGVRLGVLGRNSAEYLQLMYACADAGVIVVPLNTRWAIGELRHAVMDSGIKALAILDREFVGAALDLCAVAPAAGRGPSCLIVGPQACTSSPTSAARSEVSAWRRFSVGQADRSEGDAKSEGWRGVDDSRGDFVLARGAEEGRGEQRLSDGHDCYDSAQTVGGSTLEADGTRDVFCIVYTSGSTGRSKGVALTHKGQVFQADAKCVQLGFTSSTTYLNVLPLFHVGGISAALAVTLVGGCHVFVPRFAPGCAIAAIEAGRVNSIVVVPTMLHMLVNSHRHRCSWRAADVWPLGASGARLHARRQVCSDLRVHGSRFHHHVRFLPVSWCISARP
ncbi:unnamed protein product [Ectocarpus fasciculatus]